MNICSSARELSYLKACAAGCIYCRQCVEARPWEVIQMDTGLHPDNRGFKRKDFIEELNILTDHSSHWQVRKEPAP